MWSKPLGLGTADVIKLGYLGGMTKVQLQGTIPQDGVDVAKGGLWSKETRGNHVCGHLNKTNRALIQLLDKLYQLADISPQDRRSKIIQDWPSLGCPDSKDRHWVAIHWQV